MAEQVILNIVRPETGVGYIAESPEADAHDRLAAYFVGIDALARRIRDQSIELGKSYPKIIQDLIDADLWQHGT